jgi:Na+/H+ antiporter NhaD/arsenite permease-like protein
MLVDAALMVGLQIISIQAAFKLINLDVIGFLFGIFSIVSALDKSGVLMLVSARMLSKTRNNRVDTNDICSRFGFGFGFAFCIFGE